MSSSIRRLLLPGLLIVVVLAGSGFGFRWWWLRRGLVSTDNAYVDASIALITPRVAGTVVELAVSDNWQVKRGDLLVRLDPTDYQIPLRQAEARLADTEHQVEELRAQVRAADSQVRLTQAELELASLDGTRTEQLFQQKVVSVEDLDHSRTALRVARSRVEAAREEAERARATLGIPIDAPATDSPLVQQAAAQRDQAKLMLSYTELQAPVSGAVATRSVQLGQRVDPGQPIMRIVPLARVYVEANFKETQLTDVQIGQPATIVADIYPDYVYHGVVDGLAAGTGTAFALLPPENAAGNWIKVVQRVPVKIRLNEPPPADHPLRVGLSVVVTVDVTRPGQSLLTPLSQKMRRTGDHEH
jgi:membrane fusion protein (multidrug efflux system)